MMDSKVNSGNGTAVETPETVTKYEIRATDVVKSERTVEAAPAPEKEAEPVADHPTVTELAPAVETTIPKQAKTEPVRQRKLKRPTFHPSERTAPGVDQALTGPGTARRRKKRRHSTLPPSSETSPPIAATETPQKEPVKCSSMVEGPPELPQLVSLETESVMESIIEAKRNKVCWNVKIVKTFLDSCIHEININGWEGGSLKSMSWNKVGERLKASHKFYADHRQMKSYFDGLKSKYKAWLALKNSTHNKYDPSTNMFNLTDKEWETEMKKNRSIGPLRNAPLRFPDLCSQLFDSFQTGAVFEVPPELPQVQPATAFLAIETKAKVSPEVPQVQPATALMAVETITEVQSEVPQVQPVEMETEAGVQPELREVQPTSALEAIETKPEEPMVEVPPELLQVQPASELVAIEIKGLMSVFEEIVGVLKMIAGKIDKPEVEPPSKPTFEECEKKLHELGWVKDDPLHLVALTIFYDENNHYRELWMKLNPNMCAEWIRMIGRSKRLT